MTDISKETVSELVNGAVAVEMTPKPLADFFSDAFKGVLIRAPGSKDPVPNTACVWIGGRGVTAGIGAATDGVGLSPGESITLPIADLSKVFVVAAVANQRVQWLAI